MSVPDDTVTPTPDEIPDPVDATAPEAEPAPGEDEAGQLADEVPVMPVLGNRAGNGVA